MAFTKKTLKTVSFVVIATFFAKALGFLRNILVAGTFGVGIEAKAYTVAYNIPDLLFQSIGVSLSTVFIPIIVDYISRNDPDGANRFSSNIMNILLVLSGFLTAVGILFAPWIIRLQAGSLESAALSMATDLLRILFPVLIFMTLSFTTVGILQSHGEFNVPAVISILSNGVMIIYLIFFSKQYGIYGLSVAAVVGWFLQFAVQIPSLVRQGFRYYWILDFRHPQVKNFTLLALPVIFSTSVQSVNSFMNIKFAAPLNGGQAIPAVNYANTLYTVVVGVFSLSLSQIVFQSLANFHSMQDKKEFDLTFQQSLKIMFLGLLPLTAWLFSLSKPFIALLYQRGEFTQTATDLTSTALKFYSLGAVGYGVQELCNRTFFSMHNTKTPAVYAAIAMTVNIGLSFILSKVMGIGGISLAASISSALLGILLLIRLYRMDHNMLNGNLVVTFVKMAVSAVLTGIVSYFTFEYTINIHGNTGIIGNGGITPLWNLIALGLSMLTGGITYAAGCLLLRVEEMKWLLGSIIKWRKN